MPLELLLTLVIGGITAIAVVLHLTGRSSQKVMTAAQAREAWLRQFPENHIAQLTLAEDGHAALVQLEDDTAPLGLVWSFGADTVARSLHDTKATRAKHGLHLRFADFSAPQVLLRLSAAETDAWLRQIVGADARPRAPKET
ncbi:hypothetical protein [Pseudophaeobacter leonis]|uniref:hypothetical protein n=1 Tax=Pseudophaeobacter leonis TaxID=1144477 RepID=UPI0009F62C15|nr:hypothetical protein [Pseudophaeobacter leonis]